MVSTDLIEKKLAIMERGLKKNPTFKTLWKTASTWVTLSRHSQELFDLNRGLDLFHQASLKNSTPEFWVDFGQALFLQGKVTGDPSFVHEGLKWLKQAIAQGDGEYWVIYAEGHKLLFDLTGSQDDLEKADLVFHQAILAQPDKAYLWLMWGEMFLDSAWQRWRLSDAEMAIEKFTSLKIEGYSPSLVASYLGETLALMGLFLDDLKLIHMGKEKLLSPQARITRGRMHLIEGIYFSDSNHFVNAADCFQEELQQNGQDKRLYYALFQTFFAWGNATLDPYRIADACDVLDHLCKLCPHSSLLFIQFGKTLLRLCQIENDHLEQQATVEEAMVRFQKALSLSKDVEAQYQLAITLGLLGDITNSADYLEEAIAILTELYFQLPQDLEVIYHLAIAFSHLGELTGNVENLYESIRYFSMCISQEDEDLLCQFGYTCLVLSTFVEDENHPEKSLDLKSKAEELLMSALKLGNVEANYHLACLYSLANKNATSLRFLKRALRYRVLPSKEDLKHDEWLENVRKTKSFQTFLRNYHG